MQIPTYWSRHDFTANDRTGKPLTRTALGWSAISQADADAHAQARAQRAAQKAADGTTDDYEYGRVPHREPIVESIDLHGETIAVVTRNRYGARVLNTDRVLFADIDRPWTEVRKPGLLGILARLFGRQSFELGPEPETLQGVLAWHAQHPHTALRIYRTHAGLRLLFTDRQYDPSDPHVIEMLKSLGSDRLYIQLTKNQQTFRARLSAKPWRCGVTSPQNVGSRLYPPDWPAKLAAWAETYESKAAAFATCELIQQRGQIARDEVIETIIRLHDRATLRKALPLA